MRGLKAPNVWDCESALVGGALRSSPQRRIMRLILDGYGVRDERDGNAMAAAAERKGAPLAVDRWMAGDDGALAVRAEASGERCGCVVVNFFVICFYICHLKKNAVHRTL